MNKRLIKRILFLSVSLFVAFLIIISHVIAQEVPFYWDSINVNIDVQANGDMLVTEQQTYVFDANYTNQRYRYILLDKVDEIKEVTVQENNQIIPSETGIKNNQLWIRWQHQLKPPAKHTFVLKYRVVGGLQMDEENTQVDWKAIFADRKAPIKKAKVRVQLPEALSGKVTSFTSFGVPASARKINPRTFEFVVSNSISPQQELQVQVKFPREILNLPQPQWQIENEIWTLIFYAILLLILIYIITNKSKSRSGRSGRSYRSDDFSADFDGGGCGGGDGGGDGGDGGGGGGGGGG
ncbi:MAG TPA: DUF2207 domain-containing protein [Nostocaceae cyanobacterium]|nr:DUF2207 domain-containing protein [Nostocaceae cyanobacterium]